MVQAGLKAIYVSGWQVAGDMNTAKQTYPDQSLYPVDSVPTLVRRINNALQRADQISHNSGISEQMPYWYAPIVADAEAGFGGVLNAFELMKAMIEAGAAAVHFEDQLSSSKKCGHMGGKVLVPTQEAISKLVAARLAADVLDVPTLIVARTDALAANLLTSDVDAADRRVPHRRADGGRLLRRPRRASNRPSPADWPMPPTPIWSGARRRRRTSIEARQFAEAIRASYPDKPLAYNCSPSFNWQRALNDRADRLLPAEPGGDGLQVPVRHAGRIPRPERRACSSWPMPIATRACWPTRGLQQREFELERDHGYRAVKHQSFVGAGYFDAVTQVVAGGHSSLAALNGSTEQSQFTEKTPDFTEAEIHHVAGEELVRLGPGPHLVRERVAN